MKIIILLSSLISSLVFAQMPPGFDIEGMAKMEKAMKEMMAGTNNIENCMNSVNQDEIDALGEKASNLEKELSELCDQGKRSIAQNKAINFSKKMNTNREIVKINKCLAPLSKIMKSNSFDKMYKDVDLGKAHVCDR